MQRMQIYNAQKKYSCHLIHRIIQWTFTLTL